MGTLLYERKVRKMSQLSEVWRVHGGEIARKCPKYEIIGTGCTQYFGCDKCMGKKQVVVVKEKKKVKPVKKVKKQKRKTKRSKK